MADLLYRRDVLAAAIQHMPLPITAEHLAAANAAAGFSPHRNTARKDARALVRRGLLAPVPGPGNRTYTRTETPVAHLVCPIIGCYHREPYDPNHQTSDPADPASGDLASDALTEHLVTDHEVPQADASYMVSCHARTVTG